MFFQFSPPPVQPKQPVKKQKEDDAVLSLAPFTPNPKIFFENVKVGRTAVERLVIKNPNLYSVELAAKITFDEDVNLQLNWQEKRLPSNEQAILELIWSPTKVGSWRYMLNVNDGRMGRDIPVVLKSVSSQKNRKNQASKRKPPVKRHALGDLPNITNIPTIRVLSAQKSRNGKENVAPEFKSSEKSAKSLFVERKLCLLPETNQTYTKHNLSSATYVKDPILPLDQSDRGTTVATPTTDENFKIFDQSNCFATFETTRLNHSQKQRHQSLAGSSAKNILEANLWSNARPKRPLLSIKEESVNCSLVKQTPIKRKSEVTLTVSLGLPDLNHKERGEM